MKLIITLCMISVIGASTINQQSQEPNFDDCLHKDSISCLQVTAFRKARDFFNKPSINLFGGISFEKDIERNGKSLSNEVVDDTNDLEAIESARSATDRTDAIENFLIDRTKNFFQERSLKWDYISAARSLSSAIPEEFKQNVRAMIVEGRGKKKLLLLKKILPFLGIFKLKGAILAIVTLLGIGLIAKKALITALLSLAISGIILIKSIVAKKLKILAGLGGIGGLAKLGGLGGALSGLGGLGGIGGGGGGGGHDSYNSGYGGWSSGGHGGGGGGWGSGYDGGYGEHGSYSAPIPQSIAYSAHKASRR